MGLDNDVSKENLDNAQSFLDNIIANPEKAKSLCMKTLHLHGWE